MSEKELVFYTNPMSRGRIARWMLEEVRAPYRTEIIDYTTMKSADYTAINPMGKVPAIRHGQTVVTEAAAICSYLAEAFPESALAPKGDELAPYFRWMFFAAGPLETAVTNRALGFEVPPERRRMAGCGSYQEVMDVLDAAVSAFPYIAGERFTAADVYVGSHIGFGLAFGSFEKRPSFIDYFGRISARDAYRRAAAIDDAAIKEMQAK